MCCKKVYHLTFSTLHSKRIALDINKLNIFLMKFCTPTFSLTPHPTGGKKKCHHAIQQSPVAYCQIKI